MTYLTLMVHLQLGRSNAGVLEMAGDLAERYRSCVIGVAARQPMQMVYAEGYVSGEIYEQDRLDIEKEMKEAEAEFRSALRAPAVALEWRSIIATTMLCEALAAEVRSADLFITAGASGDMFDGSRAVDTGDLVLRAGRPVLIVPADRERRTLRRVVIGWNDTRECRRAVADALPLIRSAAFVTVVGVADADNLAATRKHLAEVSGWLGRHGVTAETIASPSTDDDATALYAIAQDQGADLMIAGAYGHSRLRERVLGGVTRDLLLRSDRCALLSH